MADTGALVRVPLTVRLKPDDKEFFSELTERSGLEPSIAARQVLELLINTMRDDGDFVITLNTINEALKESRASKVAQSQRVPGAPDTTAKTRA